jgi:hypothetical protein
MKAEQLELQANVHLAFSQEFFERANQAKVNADVSESTRLALLSITHARIANRLYGQIQSAPPSSL